MSDMGFPCPLFPPFMWLGDKKVQSCQPGYELNIKRVCLREREEERQLMQESERECQSVCVCVSQGETVCLKERQ